MFVFNLKLNEKKIFKIILIILFIIIFIMCGIGAYKLFTSNENTSYDLDKTLTDRFQLVINGAEIINAYSELVDPIDQEARLLHQASLKAGGDEEAMMMDYDYINAMEYGMPPISGWGMGIDRVLQVLTGVDNIKDNILFPLMRPEEK